MSLILNINLQYILMDLDNDLKKIIKYYLKAKNNENDTLKYVKYLERVIYLFKKIDNKNLHNFSEQIDQIYLKNIKDYVYSNIIKIINNMLIKNNKKISSEIFNIVNEGNINCITETDNIYSYEVFNDEGLTPLHKCINLGDTSILKELLKKGEKIDIVNKNGHTLLEFACLQKDPNLIQFLINHGSNMKKHLDFRKNYKVLLKVNDIDTALLLKLCMETKNNEITCDLRFLLKYIDSNSEIGINDITFGKFLIPLSRLVSSLDENSQKSLISIWKEELSFTLTNKLGCPNNNLELILINLVPFIDYKYNLSNRNLVTNELLYTIKKKCKENNYILDDDFNRLLINKIWIDYKDILPYDFIGIILSHIFSKIKKK